MGGNLFDNVPRLRDNRWSRVAAADIDQYWRTYKSIKTFAF